MKKIISGLFAVTLTLTLITGCVSKTASPNAQTTNPEASKTSPAASVAGPDENSYIHVVSGEPSVLNTSKFKGLNDRKVFYNILEPLTRVQEGKVTAAGAERWEISDDGKTYTFHLRDNYWSDGVKVRAQDYAYAIAQQATPQNAFSFASDYFFIKNYEQVYNGKLDVSSLGVQAKDDVTLILELDNPDASVLTTQIFPQREDYIKKYGDKLGTEAETVVACGPFTLTSWVHNSELNFEKNSKYWDADNVKLQKFSFKIIPEPSAQYASFENGSLDYLTVSNADYIEKFNKNAKLTSVQKEPARTAVINFNLNDALFKNKNVRLALSLALNRETIAADLNNGLTKPAYGLIAPATSVGEYNFRNEVEEPLLAISKENGDPKALLIQGMQELGLGTDPSTLTVTVNLGGTDSTSKTKGEFYQELWNKALGLNIKLAFNDSATHFATLDQGKYQVGIVSWGADPEPKFVLSRWVGGGVTGWKSSEYDDFIAKASQTIDDKERLALYAKAEALIISESVVAPFEYSSELVYSYKFIKGIPNSPFDDTGLKNIYTEGR